MDGHVKVAGVWKKLTGMHIKVAGTWKEVQKGYVKVAGVWKQFYTNAVFTLSGESGISHSTTAPATATVGVRVNTDGTIDKREGAVYTQIDAATDYVIPNGADKTNVRFRCTDNLANLAAGSSATGSWIAAPAEWYVEASTDVVPLNIDLEISADLGVSVEDTGAYIGSASSV